MRTLKTEDIFRKRYSIINNTIVKLKNGTYYNKQVAEYILNNKEKLKDSNIKRLLDFDKEQLDINAIKYFKNKYAKLLTTEDNSLNLLYSPYKKFEIFNIDLYGGKTILVEANSLPDGESRDLYYNFEIANKIYNNLIDIKDSTFNDYDEVQYLYARDILREESEIEELKKKDLEMFEKDTNTYRIISETSLFDNYKLLNRDKEYLLKENEKLNKIISEYNEKIKDLNQKLKNSLDMIEVLKTPKTFFEKLKNLFRSNKSKILLEDKKGGEDKK